MRCVIARATGREVGLAFLAALAATFALRWDALRLPFFWDEAGFYAQFAYSLHAKGFAFDTEWVKPFFIHPPLYYGAMAAVTRVFGFSVAVVRVVGFVAAAAYLTAAYALARRYVAPRTAALATTALAFSPVYLSEAGLMHPDLLMGAFGVGALVAVLDGRVALGSALFTAGVLVNAPLAAIAPVYAWLLLTQKRNQIRPASRVPLPTFFLPAALGLAAWFAWYAHVAGPGASEARADVFLSALVPLLKRFAHRGVQLLIWDARYALTAAVACVAALSWRRKKGPVPARELAPLLAFIAMHWVFLTAVGFSHERYFAAALPALYVAGAWAFERLVPKYAPAALALLALAGVQAWHDDSDRFSGPEYRAEYRDQVRLAQRVASDLESRFPGRPVITRWPLTDALDRPFLGYVTRPVTEVIDLESDGPRRSTYRFPTHGYPVLALIDDGREPRPEVAQEIERLRSERFSPLCETYEQGRYRAEVCQLKPVAAPQP